MIYLLIAALVGIAYCAVVLTRLAWLVGECIASWRDEDGET